MTKVKSIIISIIIVLVIIFHEYIYIGLWLGAAYIEKFYTDIECSIIENNYREENESVAKNWIRDTYGKVVSDIIEIKYVGKADGWGTASVFNLSTPFIDGILYVESNKEHKVIGGLNIDSFKFQQLYSNWVKKQVGIEDENVELGFVGNYDIPYIEFDKITSLSDDYKEIFENTHNLYLNTITVNNYNINEQNYVNCFNKIKNDIYLKCYNITGKPNERYSLFVYIDGYRFIYNYPEEEIANISKKNENPKDYGGAIWSDITQYNNIFK